MSSILVTRKLPSSVIAKLSAAGDVDLYTGEAAIPADELRARIAEKDALVCLLTDAIDRTVIDAAPSPKAIAWCGAVNGKAGRWICCSGRSCAASSSG